MGKGYNPIVEIVPTDTYFVSRGCGEWKRSVLNINSVFDPDTLRYGVVQVITEFGRGSGFIWDVVDEPMGEERYAEFVFIITNQHVIENEDSPRVLTADLESYEAHVLGSDVVKDVALLVIAGCCFDSVAEGSAPLPIVNPNSIRGITRAGISVAALGYPYGEYEPTLGDVVDIPYLSERDLIPHSASLNPGNSGGPLISTVDGKVIGINTYGSNRAGYAVPIYSVEGLIGQWCLRSSVMSSRCSELLEGQK